MSLSKTVKLIPRCVLGVAVLLLAAALLPSAGEAAWPGREGPILYRGLEPGFESEGWDPVGLGRLRFGLSNARDQVTTDPSDQDPQASPNGQLIVFSRGTEPNARGIPTARAIFVMQRDGSELRQLTRPHPSSDDLEPTFDAAGRRIFFVRLGDETVRGSNHGDICSVNPDGLDLRRLTSSAAADFSPTASPRGNQVVFSRSDWRLPGGGRSSLQHLFSIRPDGSRLRDLTPRLRAPVSDPDFSPSGRAIAVALGSSFSDIFTLRPNGSRLRRLTGRHGRSVLHGYDYYEPAFSPAGGELFAVAKNAYNTELAQIELGDPDHPHRLNAGDQAFWAPALRGR